jgi:hypothetical protein
MRIGGELLRADAGLFSYNVTMTSPELWRAVGRELRDVRERQGKKWNHIARETKPRLDAKTQQDIERGEPGTREALERYARALERYARALGLSIVDVLSGVLKAAEQRPTPEAAALLRCFEQLDVENRRLVLWTAQRLLEQQPVPDGGSGPTPVPVRPSKKPPAR